jgi:hypothetical protein
MMAGLSLIAGFLFLSPTASFADSSPAIGMNGGDVQRVWGDPAEKIAYETKREELWRYDTSEVRFREGKVVAWRYLEENLNANTLETGVADTRGAGGDKEVAVADILTEIMRELPEGGGK